jgi:transketolase
MALGLEFLKQEFGITPNISLNVDSFGHSAAQSWLYSEMGFNGNMVERLDDAVVD